MTGVLGNEPLALELRVLGPVAVLREGQPVRLGGLRQRAVLARLICNVGRVVTIDQLASAVWADAIPPGHVSTLQTYVFHLRAALEPNRRAGAVSSVLRTETGGYRLDLDANKATLDALQFEELVAAGRSRLAANEPGPAADHIRAAIELWRGDVMTDLRDFLFVPPYADRLTELLADAREIGIDAELALGNDAQVVDATTAAVAAHPLRERFHAQRMLALYRCGRQADALSGYMALRDLLVDELGIEPNQQIQDLHRQILDQDAALAWHPTVRQQPSIANSSSVLPVSSTTSRIASTATGGAGRPSKWRSLSRRLTLFALATALILVAGTVTAVALINQQSSARSAIANSAVEVGTNGHVRVSVPVGGPPGGIAVTAGSVWIAEPQGSSVLRMDAKTRRRTATIPVGNAPVALAPYEDELWVADGSDGDIQEISVQANTVTHTIAVGHDPSALAGGLGYLWVANRGDGTVTRIDPSGRVAARTIAVGSEPDGIAVGDNAVWVANQFDNTVTRIDPSSLATTTIGVGVGPEGITVTTNAVWVADNLDLTVARIDLSRNDSVTKVETGDSPTAVAEFGGSIWVSNAGDATISRLDETTGRVRNTYSFGSSPTGFAVAGSALWVSSKAYAAAEHRGGTLTVATVTPDDEMASIDPALAYDGDLYDGMAEVYDTLVTVRKSAGLTGLDLVPDLAEQLPIPTDSGLTYVFRLRPGIKYSDGEPLRASDFRRGIERTLIVEPSSAIGYFNDIVGADACTQKPASCDLSTGIVTDDAAGTITFHLTAADPDLLGALSITGFSTPVPPNTPMTHDIGTAPVPGTGPYLIGQFTPNHSLTLVRNPHFVRWSSAAQPDGYPDQIVWKGYQNQAAAIAAVGAGSGADVFYVNRLEDRNASATRLLQAYPQQLVNTQSFASHFLVLNANAPPFNNPKARQAVAQALTADPTLAAIDDGTASCTIVPPGFPGQPTSCAYTENRATAAAAVLASGTAGATVHVYFINKAPFTQLGAYVTDVLNQIGYHATLTLEDNYQADTYDPKTRPVNIEGETWFPDFPSESQFWLPVTCEPPSYLTALGGCNPQVDAAANTALAAQATNASAAQVDWQHVYSLMDSDARLIPLDVPPGVNLFVSPRVGNPDVTPNSDLEALLDQFWIK
jgi:YVTN family beta-propeller protein